MPPSAGALAVGTRVRIKTPTGLLTGSLLIVPIVELLNSAIEANVDRVGPEHHELSARAKDIASAAVFLSLVFAAVVWLLVLVPKIA